MSNIFIITVIEGEQEDGSFRAIFPGGVIHRCMLCLTTKEKIQSKLLDGYSLHGRCSLASGQDIEVRLLYVIDGVQVLDLKKNTRVEFTYSLSVFYS